MAIRTLLWRGLDAPRMEIVRVESLDRAHGTQIGIAYELRWKLDGAVLELTMDGGPGIRVELGEAEFFDLHHSAFFNSLPVARDGLLERRRGRAGVHHALRARPGTDRTASLAAVRAAREPGGALPLQRLPGGHHLRCGRIRHPLPGLSRTGRVRQLTKAGLHGGTTRRQHWRADHAPR